MPLEFVVVTVETPVCTFVMVTVTPETTAPEASETVPLISPVFEFCATVTVAIRMVANSTLMRPKWRTVLNLIAEPPKIDSPQNQRQDLSGSIGANSLRSKESSKHTTGETEEILSASVPLRIRQKLDRNRSIYLDNGLRFVTPPNYKCTKPRCSAVTTASVRSFTPKRTRIALTWDFTVASVIAK